MDMKISLEDYDKVVGVKVNINDIKRSIKLIINSKIDHEFRMTVLPRLHSNENIIKAAKQLKGSDKFYLQQFCPRVTLDKSFQKEKPFKKEEIEKIKEEIKGYFNVCEIRY